MVEQSLPATHEQSSVGVDGSGTYYFWLFSITSFFLSQTREGQAGGEETLGTTRQVAEVVIKVRRPTKRIREAHRHHEAQWCLCRGERRPRDNFWRAGARPGA